MSCSIIHTNVRSVLEEDSTAYTTVVETGGAPNMDYAGYCCHVSLNRLKQCLGDPAIPSERLEGLLRRAARKYSLDNPQKDWAGVMARYIVRHANAN
jgi:hypothetical protein